MRRQTRRPWACALRRHGAARACCTRLSWLVIGEELQSQNLQRGDAVVLLSAQALTARYEQALAQLGVWVQRVGDGATWRSPHAIVDTLSL